MKKTLDKVLTFGAVTLAAAFLASGLSDHMASERRILVQEQQEELSQVLKNDYRPHEVNYEKELSQVADVKEVAALASTDTVKLPKEYTDGHLYRCEIDGHTYIFHCTCNECSQTNQAIAENK